MIEDIPTLQSMIKKRDEIIKELKEKLARIDEARSIKARIPEDLVMEDSDIDYREVCEQLKAATGEITRLEANATLSKDTNASLFKACDQYKIDVEGMAETIDKLQKQLDQECNSNAELEDKMNIRSDKSIYDEDIRKADEKVKLLEEKLALCDGYYQALLKNTTEVKDFINKIFT